MKIGRAQPPVRREGCLEIAAPDGPEHGLGGQVTGQQASSALTQRQFGLVSLEPRVAHGQIS